MSGWLSALGRTCLWSSLMGTLSVLGTAVGAFTVTNVDAFLILTLLFAASRSTGVLGVAQILAGQGLGFAAWMTVSVLGAAGLRLVPDRWVGLAGLLPIALGVHALLRARGRDANFVPATGTLSVAGLTAANGVDNVTVYVLLFARQPASSELLTIATFVCLLVVWCCAAAVLGCRKKIVELAAAFGRWLVPTVFIGVGVWVLVNSGALTNLGVRYGHH